MIQIAVTKDFGEGIETRIITYSFPGYSVPDSANVLPYAAPDQEIEDSFVGASMFGWDAPVAEAAHEWVAEMMEPDGNWSEQGNHTHEV